MIDFHSTVSLYYITASALS